MSQWEQSDQSLLGMALKCSGQRGHSGRRGADSSGAVRCVTTGSAMTQATRCSKALPTRSTAGVYKPGLWPQC